MTSKSPEKSRKSIFSNFIVEAALIVYSDLNGEYRYTGKGRKDDEVFKCTWNQEKNFFKVTISILNRIEKLLKAQKKYQGDKFETKEKDVLHNKKFVYKEALEHLESLGIIQMSDAQKTRLGGRGQKDGPIEFRLVNMPSDDLTECMRFVEDVLIGKVIIDKESSPADDDDDDDENIDDLVKIIRQQTYSDIDFRCGTVRMLEMTQPIRLSKIYTDTNAIQDPIEKLFQTTESLDSDTVPALDVVKEKIRLILLGKPGSGKTTFLKYLAILSN